MRIYVGNLDYRTTNQELMDFFTPCGQVEQAYVVLDRGTRRSRGFGFVEMLDNVQAQEAIRALDGVPFNGRTLIVNEARERTEASANGPDNRRGQSRGHERGHNSYR